MEKITDITKIFEDIKEAEKNSAKTNHEKTAQKTTNPILKKLAQFKNDNISKKFDINDLLR